MIGGRFGNKAASCCAAAVVHVSNSGAKLRTDLLCVVDDLVGIVVGFVNLFKKIVFWVMF